MWTPATRRQHSRKHLRYETDLTDEEWAIIAPYLPGSPVRGRPHKWSMREIVNAIFYVLRGGVAWSLLPREFPPRSTVFHWFSVFRDLESNTNKIAHIRHGGDNFRTRWV